jgi:hypothetical protein
LTRRHIPMRRLCGADSLRSDCDDRGVLFWSG